MGEAGRDWWRPVREPRRYSYAGIARRLRAYHQDVRPPTETVVEGFTVTGAHNATGRRVWHCSCKAFQRRAHKGDVFCEHVVIAIDRAAGHGRLTT
jgi:hypothetical protein